MTALVVILIVLALIFGVGAVVEGIAWVLLIGIVLLAVALARLAEAPREPARMMR